MACSNFIDDLQNIITNENSAFSVVISDLIADTTSKQKRSIDYKTKMEVSIIEKYLEYI